MDVLNSLIMVIISQCIYTYIKPSYTEDLKIYNFYLLIIYLSKGRGEKFILKTTVHNLS